MNMPSAQLERFEALESANLMRFRPILLPQPPIVKGDNNHIAWPIATLADGVLLVIYSRRFGHYVAPRWNEHSNAMNLTRSFDGGETWTEPVDVREYARDAFGGELPEYLKSRVHSLDTLEDGTVLIEGSDGTYRSRDAGETWSYTADRYPDNDRFDPTRDPFPHCILSFP